MPQESRKPVPETRNLRAVPGDRKRHRAEIKREVVLETAVALFNEKGFRATSLDEVARKLGVTKPTIYQYVASKDEILFDCVIRGLEMIRDAAENAARGHHTGRDKLEAAMHAYAIAMTMDFCRCVTRTADTELSDDSRKEFRRLKRAIDEMMRGMVRAGIADGSLRGGDVRMITFTLTGTLNWIGRWYEPAGEMEPEFVASSVVRTLMSGLAPELSVQHAG